MDQFEKDQFWAGLNRLYVTVQELAAASAKQAESIAQLAVIAQAHERRLDELDGGEV